MDPASPVVGALSKLIPVAWEKLQKELKLASDAEKEFDDLKDLIEKIGDFLEKAYSKEVIDTELKRGMKRMRNFLYDSEDAIEDLGRHKLNGKWEGLASYLSHLYGDRNFSVESNEIKEKLEEYTDKLGRTAPIENHYGLSGNQTQSSSAGQGSSSNAFFDETDALVGIEGPMNQLVQWLTENPPKSKVIFIRGAQGVGKTSLVAAGLRHQRVRGHFKYCVWVDDLRSCELADDTAAALMKSNATLWDWTMREGNNQGSPIALKEAFRLMKEKEADDFSWALVLDDVSRADVFESLQAKLIETRPSVLVTTRVRSLASSSKDYLKRAQYVPLDFEHVFLSENDSRSLFFREMEDIDLPLKCENSRPLMDASDRILRRCKGLPLAILATCRLLRKNNLLGVKSAADAVKWTDLSGRLEVKLLSKGHVVYPNGRKITLRMDRLADVRDCLCHLSIFPLDRPIRCSTMMRLWMAQGFIKNEDSQPVQEKAEETLEKLLDHNSGKENKLWEDQNWPRSQSSPSNHYFQVK